MQSAGTAPWSGFCVQPWLAEHLGARPGQTGLIPGRRGTGPYGREGGASSRGGALLRLGRWDRATELQSVSRLGGRACLRLGSGPGGSVGRRMPRVVF